MGNAKVRKHCRQCGGDGPFGKLASSLDGLYPLCKPCINEHQKRRNATPKGKATTAWQSILKRAKNRNGINRTYAAVEVQVAREDFMAWALPAFAEWMEANPSKVPSVNRINNNHGYCLGNLEVIEWGENSRLRPSNKNIHAPEGQAWCSGCKQYLPQSLFRLSSDRANGLLGKCRCCERKYNREYMRRWVERNREKHNRYQREWRRRHKSKAVQTAMPVGAELPVD